MSLKAVAWVLTEAPGVKPHLVSLLIGIAEHADDFGRGAYPGQEKLASYTRKSLRQVKRDIRDAEKDGLIRRGNQALVAHISADTRPVVWDLAMDERGDVDVTTRGDTHDTSSTSRRDTGDTTRGDVGDRAWGRTRPPNRKENPKKRVTKDSLADERFDEFWTAYPRKANKPAAAKAWAKAIERASPDQIIAAAAKYARARRGQDQKYTAHPATWLNGDRWNDEPPPRASSNGHVAYQNPPQSAYDEWPDDLAEMRRDG